MTKYVLNSGGLKNQPSLTKEFFAEAVKGLGNKPRVLMCLFALPRQDWEKRFASDCRSMEASLPEGVAAVFDLAFPDTFAEQIGRSEMIFIRGGDDHLIDHWMRKFDIPRIWEGKVIATSSAGSDVLCNSFWTCDWRTCMDGLGILPIKFLPHFESDYGNDDPRGPVDWQNALSELKAYKDGLPVHALKEGEFVVFKK